MLYLYPLVQSNKDNFYENDFPKETNIFCINVIEMQIDIYKTLKQLYRYITWHSFTEITKKQKKLLFSLKTAPSQIAFITFTVNLLKRKSL